MITFPSASYCNKYYRHRSIGLHAQTWCKKNTLGQMPALRQENTHKGIWRYCDAEFPPILSEVSTWNSSQYRKTENGHKRRARRLNAQSLLPNNNRTQALSYLSSIILALVDRMADKTVSHTTNSASTSSSLHLDRSWFICSIPARLCSISG